MGLRLRHCFMVHLWFYVEVKNKVMLNAFAMFTLGHEKVTKVVEVLSLF